MNAPHVFSLKEQRYKPCKSGIQPKRTLLINSQTKTSETLEKDDALGFEPRIGIRLKIRQESARDTQII